MKPYNLVKQHPLVSIVILILLIWAGVQIWPLVKYKLFSKKPITYVETVVLKPQAGVLRWQAVGTIKAAQDIVIDSEISGVVQEVVVKNGQAVKQDDILLTIRHGDVLANLQKDQAVLTQKQLHYQRYKSIVKSNSVSQEQLGEALSEYQQAEAAVNADQALLDKYIIKAPFDGVIGIWQVDIGKLVRPGDALVTLTQLTPAYVDFMLPAKALNYLAVGETIKFTSGSYTNRTWQGKVVAIEPQLDNATRSVSLRAQIDNTDGKLVPRLYGQVTLEKPLPPQVVIPQEAVIYDPEGASVYVLKDNVPSQQHITLGTREGNEVVVEKGLKANDEVVTAGMMKLYPGAAVKINKKVVQTPVVQSTS